MISVRGVDLAVSERGTGPAFFWGHGFASSRAQDDRSRMLDWSHIAARHRVVRWDARGHGESGGTAVPADYAWDNLGRDLVALADALAVDRFAAGGVSMGAAAALHAATCSPDRIAGLVLVLPPTAYETHAAQADEYTIGADTVERAGVGSYVEQVNAQPVPAILRKYAAGFRFEPAVEDALLPSVLRGAATSDLPDPEMVRTLDLPTLLLAWDGDPGHPRATAECLVELLPDAELHIADRLREVAAWTDLVDAFLSRCLPAARGGI